MGERRYGFTGDRSGFSGDWWREREGEWQKCKKGDVGRVFMDRGCVLQLKLKEVGRGGFIVELGCEMTFLPFCSTLVLTFLAVSLVILSSSISVMDAGLHQFFFSFSFFI